MSRRLSARHIPYSLLRGTTSASYVTIASHASLYASSDFTLTFWIQRNEDLTSAGTVGIVSKRTTAANREWGIYWDRAASALKVDIQTSSVETLFGSSGIFLPRDRWIPCALRKSGTDVSLFVNRTEHTASTSGTTIPNNSQNLYLNAYGGDFTSNNLQARLTEVGYWTRALSDDEIDDALFDGDFSTDSLAGLWLFSDGGTSTTLTDSSINANHGTITAPTWSHGVPSQNRLSVQPGAKSMRCEATNARAKSASNAVFSAQSWTMATWIYTDSVTTAQGSMALTDGTSSTRQVMGTCFPAVTQLHYYDTVNGVKQFTAPGRLIPLQKWTHVGLVKSGNTVTGYVNGRSIGSVTLSSPAPYASANTLEYGNNGAGTEYHRGNLTRMHFKASASTASEMFTLYKDGILSDPTVQVLVDPDAGDTSSTLVDTSGNGINLTISVATLVNHFPSTLRSSASTRENVTVERTSV